MEKEFWSKKIDGFNVLFQRTVSDNPLTRGQHTSGWKIEIGSYSGPHEFMTRKEIEKEWKELWLPILKKWQKLSNETYGKDNQRTI